MPKRASWIVLLLSWLPLIAGCQVIDSDPTAVYPIDERYLLTVENRTELVLDIDLDGDYLATLRGHDALEVVVLRGYHRLGAYSAGRGDLVATTSFDLDSDFVWIISER